MLCAIRIRTIGHVVGDTEVLERTGVASANHSWRRSHSKQSKQEEEDVGSSHIFTYFVLVYKRAEEAENNFVDGLVEELHGQRRDIYR